VLTFTPGGGSTGSLSGTLTASPSQKYIIEIFSNPSAPAAGRVQGKTFVQDVTVYTDGFGEGTFSVTEPLGIYTATSTDDWLGGNTSAFSDGPGSPGLPATVTKLSSSLNPSTVVGQPVTFTAVVTAGGFLRRPPGR
jgi:hypothetical protein